MKKITAAAISLKTIILILFGLPAIAQDIVVIHITPPPLNQLSIADLWRVDLTSMARGPVDVYLTGTVEEQREGLVGEARSSVLQLAPGMNRLSGREVQPVNVIYASERYRNATVRTGGFPAGSYTLCVIAFEVQSDREVGRDCLDHEVQPFSPPELISPVAGETLSQAYPVFVWTPLAPLPSEGVVRYRIKMVRVLRGQPPSVAARSNLSWFEIQNLTLTSFPYPAEARTLEEGTYAWFVEATGLRQGDVLSRSEVEIFQWKPAELQITPGVIATVAPHGIPFQLFEELMRPCTGNPAAPAMVPYGRIIMGER